MADPDRARYLKEEGNKVYQAKNWAGAEGIYSKAIIADPSNTTLYTNRAMSRLKLGLWDLVIDDCNVALRHDANNMKAHYQISQAQLELGDLDESVTSARKAHQLALVNNDKSLPSILSQVRKAIRARWEHLDRRRIRETGEAEQETIDMYLERGRAAAQECTSDVERAEVEAESKAKVALMRDVFERARSKGQQSKVPPDWIICDISFQVMIDPVMTKAGHSYDRQSIMEHIRYHPTDPYTRESLYPGELRPNLTLKKAIDEYLAENGWAAEY